MGWELRWDEEPGTRAIPLGRRPVYIGRAPTNDVVLAEPSVSGRHAAVWVGESGVLVEDLHSRNGTFVNRIAIQGIASVRSADELRLGQVTLHLARTRTPGPTRSALVVLERRSGVALPVHGDRLRIGRDARADLRADVEPEVVLIFQGDEVWLGEHDHLVRLTLDTPFTVGDLDLCVQVASQGLAPTNDLQQQPYPYVLEASIDSGRPRALLVARDSDARHEVTAPTRATLLWVLARQHEQDAELPQSERGWVDARDLRIAVWGREAAESEERLTVLIHRVRKELRGAGFDPYFLERRGQQVRARVTEARLG